MKLVEIIRKSKIPYFVRTAVIICFAIGWGLMVELFSNKEISLKFTIGVPIVLMVLAGLMWCINTIYNGIKERKKGNPDWHNSIRTGLLIRGTIIITAIIIIGIRGVS